MLVALAERTVNAPPKAEHPQGWQPGLTWSPTSGGDITTVAIDGTDADPAFWQLVIADWGLDPETTEIVPDSVQIRAWDMPIGNGETMRARYYKARIRPRRASLPSADAAELVRLATRRGPAKPPAPSGEGVALVVNLSDFQIGKGEGGGTAATVTRIRGALEQTAARIKHLRRAGWNVEAVYLIGLGDLAEQCIGHYPSQQFTVDCDRRTQIQLVRTLIIEAVDLFVNLVGRVVVGAVPGNHGENRANGKSITTVTDNDDLAVFDQVQTALAMNPARYGHVTFAIATDLVLTLNVCGVEIGWTHMHQGSGSGERKIADWWRGQVMGNRPISSAQILNTAHYHHFLCSESTGRTILQVPAMDGGSGWWVDKTGQSSPPGMVSYLAGVGCGPRGWAELAIITGEQCA